jgi:hypothetical protein
LQAVRLFRQLPYRTSRADPALCSRASDRARQRAFSQRAGSDGAAAALNRIFEHGLHFEPSHEHAGLQLVDVVAYVTRRVILEPENDVIHRAYAHLRDNLRTERDGQALRLVSGGGGREQEIDDYRYRLVL